MSRDRSGWIAWLLFVASANGCGLMDPAQFNTGVPENAVKVLSVNPITGSLSFMGPTLEHAMEFAAKEINAAGGILGRPLALIKTDEHSDELAAASEVSYYYRAHKDVVAIAGASLDAASKRILTEIAKNGFEYGGRIPMVSPASTSAEFEGLLDAQYNLFFRTVCSSHLGGSILADKAKSMGYRRGAALAFVDINNKEVFRTFREKFEGFGPEYTVSLCSYQEPTLAAIREALAQAYPPGGSAPEFLLVLAYGSDGKIVLNEWARRYAKTPLLLSNSLMSDYFFASLDPQTLTELNRAVVNGVFPTHGAARGFGLFAKAFCKEYPDDCTCLAGTKQCEADERLEPGMYASNAYDVTYVLALGLAIASRHDPSSIVRGNNWDVDALKDGMLRGANRGSGEDVSILPGEWKKALDAIRAGQDVDYLGSSSVLELNPNGDPVNCTFGFWTVEGERGVFRNSDGEIESVNVSL